VDLIEPEKHKLRQALETLTGAVTYATARLDQHQKRDDHWRELLQANDEAKRIEAQVKRSGPQSSSSSRGSACPGIHGGAWKRVNLPQELRDAVDDRRVSPSVAAAANLTSYLPDPKLRGGRAHFGRSGDDAHLKRPTISFTRMWNALAEANSMRATDDGGLLPVRDVAPGTTYPVEALPASAPEA